MRYPYSRAQITGVVDAEKHPRDWEPLEFKTSGEASRQCDCWLERIDGKLDRIRLVVRAGRLDIPNSYAASLLLEDIRIRGIDYHAVARKRFYKEVSPKGWHEDIIDPNSILEDRGRHERVALPDFKPLNFADFLKAVCRHWNIVLPPDSETLL